jgi:hypothetical protein
VAKEGRTYQIDATVSYYVSPKHRDGTPRAGQWKIGEADEVAVFTRSARSRWIVAATGWGLHVPDERRATWLGVADDHTTPAFLAKFVTDADRKSWHGYPVINDRSEHCPPREVIRDWMRKAFIAPNTADRLIRGRPCLSL